MNQQEFIRVVMNPVRQRIIQYLILHEEGTAASFTGYFADEGNDFRKDMLSLTTSTLLLTDEEYMEMTGKIGAVFNEYIYNKPEEGRRPRRITFISSPCEEEQE